MTVTRTQLRSRLQAFDGRAISLLSETAADLGTGPHVIDLLIMLTSDPEPNISMGATWLLKAHLDQKNSFTRAQTAALIAVAPDFQPWQAQLHICQMIARMDVAPDEAAPLADWLTKLLTHQRPFLRAWSMDALCSLAAIHPGLAARARAAHKAGTQDPAGSVRSRARNINPPKT